MIIKNKFYSYFTQEITLGAAVIFLVLILFFIIIISAIIYYPIKKFIKKYKKY